jgi:uncharacterized OsmC-like protein
MTLATQEIREAQEKYEKVLAENPDKARSKNAPATAKLQAGLKLQVTGPRGELVETDMPSHVGGQGSAPAPSWLMRAGLASCTASTIAMRAAKLGIELDTLEVTVETESDYRGFLGMDDSVSAALSGLRTAVRIGAKNADAKQLRELVRWGDEHSPVACTLREAGGGSLEIDVI